MPLLISVLSAQAAINPTPIEELKPTPDQAESLDIIKHILETYHYKKQELDDQLSNDILENYLDSLDANRSFFMQSDVEGFFRDYQFELDDLIKDGNVNAAFEIFKVHRQRVKQRVLYALDQLKQEHDFSIDEEFQFDRRDTEWKNSIKELDELWRKRVKNDILSLKLTEKEYDEIISTLEKRYRRILNSTLQLNRTDVFQTFINAYTTAIEPHTAYFSPRISENFDISMRLSLEGIGAVLRAESDYTQIQRIIPGGPADLSQQLKAEDRIIGVGQDEDGEIVDVVGWRLDDVVDLIRGPKGSSLRIEILPGDAGADGPSKLIPLVRDEIKLEESAAKSSIIEVPDSGNRIGVIELESFYVNFEALANGDKNYRSTSRDVRKLLAELEQDNIAGLVIDLRGNGGGSLAEALQLTGLFIPEGPIVQTKDANGRIEINDDPDPNLVYAGPLAVLVDRNSASASEIFAGAIQDYQRGVIIGEPTFGKGTVQSIVDLNQYHNKKDTSYGKLKTTVAQFFRISGGSNQHKGVVPDIIMPTAINSDDHGERSYENALPWDKVKPAKFIPASAPRDLFQKAKQLHEERIQNDRVFQVLIEEIELLKENADKKTVTLNEAKRKIEREKLTATKDRLENEFRVAQGLPPLNEEEEEEEEALDKAEEEEKAVESDVILKESAKILNDLIVPFESPAEDLQTVKKIELGLDNNNL